MQEKLTLTDVTYNEVHTAMNFYVMFGASLLISSPMCCQKSKEQGKRDEGCMMKSVEEILI
jgi:hypothetical protein